MTFQADTIIYDAQKIAEYQADSRFDYNAQLYIPEYSWFNMFTKWFNHFLHSIFSGKFEENVTMPIFILLLIVIILFILYFLYKKRSGIFIKEKKTAPLPYDVEEENIHGIEFNKDIITALDCGDYRLAIRLQYLHTLRLLSDNNLINWQIYKTPTEYLYEIRNHEMKPMFRELTNRFLRVRYGNYAATSELYDTICNLQAGIKKMMEGGKNEG